MADGEMAQMPGHMHMTMLRSPKADDQQEANAVASAAKSISRWHQHINFCKAPMGQRTAYSVPEAKFGLRGSIITMDGPCIPIRERTEERVVDG
jgi:hypothetical protein